MTDIKKTKEWLTSLLVCGSKDEAKAALTIIDEWEQMKEERYFEKR